MHIQSITIKNFKSYRDFSLVETLDTNVNLIIGSNGHGKSNFLDAIIFVLTDKYSNLRHEDKKLLVHEEPGEEIDQISVEIVIENKLRRFPIHKDFIKIKKVYHVSQNLEEIFINDKKLLKSDFNNLLESGGFCRQNPYYIIQQGKVNSFINMNDFELFHQFSELTGTKIYEEKKHESLKLLQEASENKNKIKKQAEQVEEYIEKLEVQCEELKNFEKFEKTKKACQEIIFSDKLGQIQLACDILEERKIQKTNDLQDLLKNSNELKINLNTKVCKLTALENRQQKISSKINKCNEEISNLKNYQNKEKASLNLLESNKINIDLSKSDLISELTGLENKKKTLNSNLDSISAKLKNINNEIFIISNNFHNVESQIEFMSLKLTGNKATFKSSSENKNFLNQEIKALKNLKEASNTDVIKLQQDISQEKKSLEKLLSNKDEATNKKTQLLEEIQKTNTQLQEKQKGRVENINYMKKNELKINDLNEELETLKDNNKGLVKLIPNYDVLSAVLEIKKMKIPGFVGILIEIIEVDSRFKDSVDIISKDKLYSIIVDNFETANQIININKQKNGPVISILPLDWNKDSNKHFNYSELKDSSPLINYIKIKANIIPNFEKYQADLHNLINKIFGKTLLVKNYETGLKLAKQAYMNCVTRDNEIIYAGAILTKIGSYDNQRQRLNFYEQISSNFQKANELELLKSQFERIKIDGSNNEAQALREIQALQLSKGSIITAVNNLAGEENKLNEQVINLTASIRNKQQKLENLLSEKTTLENKLQNYLAISDAESNTANDANIQARANSIINLNEKSLETINSLKSQKALLERKLIELENLKKSSENKKMEFEAELNEIIIKREKEIKSELYELDSKFHNHSNAYEANDEGFIRAEVEASIQEILSLESFKQKLKQESDKIRTEHDITTRDITVAKKEVTLISEKITSEENELKSIMLSLNENSNKKNSIIKKISNLGKIDVQVKEKLVALKNASAANNDEANNPLVDLNNPGSKLDKALEPIFKELDRINQKLKKFEKINRFAIEDYKSFKAKSEEISEKLNDLKSKENEILSVINTLDTKKVNAIQTTFEKVNKSFEVFFKQLVPHGKSFLELYDVSNGNTQISSLSSNYGENNLANYANNSKGISIKVSFSGSNNYYQSMHLLSGGQKTAVALSLIFALSRVDQAPFYILDEIDAALDVSMRNNLSKLILDLSQENQFIISTFKSEILEVANNIYKVKFANKTTNITKISKDEAKNFIREINSI